jgi:hypothetical protein
MLKMVMDMEITKQATLAGGRLIYRTFKTFEHGITVFGISVTSNLFETPEEDIISDVTVSEATIDRLFDLCVEHSVLPSSLRDIVEDFIISEEVTVS